ncbi:MAG: DUF4433 domain-containing protein [Nitrospiraceae bacterium]|nr:DUF4433 domain-containing protein [Nitrospiraceae bacterium]
MNHKLSPDQALLFRIVHVKNMPWILEHGLHCRNSKCIDPGFVNIGNVDLIGKRNPRSVPVDPGGGLSDLGEVDWPLLRSKNFQNDPDDPGKKERYQAEALAYQHVPVNALLGIVCYTDGVRNQLQDACKSKGLNIRLEVRPGWYF